MWHVIFVSPGSKSNSDAHVLECSGFPVLQRGDINFFLIHTAESLGTIQGLRFWHHNSGDSPAMVQELQFYLLIVSLELNTCTSNVIVVHVYISFIYSSMPISIWNS